VDHRELNIANAMGRCVHFRGIGDHITCAAGVHYDVVTLRHEPMPYKNRWGRDYTSSSSMPCWLVGSPHNLAGATCAKRQTMTREEAEAQQVRREQEIAAMGVARKAIIVHIDATGQYSGTIPCPTCKTGTLGYSRARSNGHVHARCSTEGCHAWME
jgi:hypothetical protein